MTKGSWEGMTVRIGKVHVVSERYNDDVGDVGCGYTYCGISVGVAILVDPSDPTCKHCVKAYAKKSQNEGSVNRKKS